MNLLLTVVGWMMILTATVLFIVSLWHPDQELRNLAFALGIGGLLWAKEDRGPA